MKRLAIAALVAACGYAKPALHQSNGSSDGGVEADAAIDAMVDASRDAAIDAPAGVCNILTQTGCGASEKCTWIIDSASGTTVGHIGCAPNGSQAVGFGCTRNAPGSTGYDDCARGAYCMGPATGGAGTCKAICDNAGGAPQCGNGFVCTTYDGVFGPSGQVPAAGVCDPTCDPLADNNFLGSTGNNRTGSTCGSAGSAAGVGFIYAKGCYGFPSANAPGTRWTCSAQLNPSRVHRTACDVAAHAGDTSTCASSATTPYLNGCASGYEPMFYDAEGSTQIDCIAMCSPAICYNAGTGTTSNPQCGAGLANLSGASGHPCKPSVLQYAGTFNTASSTNNGEQCMYSWVFELDSTGHLLRSPTSDTVGFCVDHSKYLYDPTGGTNKTATWPRCDLIGLGSNGYGVGAGGMDAVGFGCVDTATAQAAGELMFSGKAKFKRQSDLRLPYHRVAR